MKTKTHHTKKSNRIKTKTIQKEIAQKTNPYLGMAKGLVMAFAVTCIFFIGYGIAITNYGVSYDKLPVVVLVCTAVSSLIAGYDFAIHSEKRGILIGAVGGIFYIALLSFVAYLAEGTLDFYGSVWKMGIVAILSGGIGGIFGANGRS
ncbi:MAG: TIGR04086 family membrane protein [Bacillota bacterium]